MDEIKSFVSVWDVWRKRNSVISSWSADMIKQGKQQVRTNDELQ